MDYVVRKDRSGMVHGYYALARNVARSFVFIGPHISVTEGKYVLYQREALALHHALFVTVLGRLRCLRGCVRDQTPKLKPLFRNYFSLSYAILRFV